MHIGIIGCGQLSRMLALAGIPLGFRFTFLADVPGQDTRCVEQLGDVVLWDPEQDQRSLFELMGHPDVVTAEKEQLDPTLLEVLRDHCPVHPNPFLHLLRFPCPSAELLPSPFLCSF